jgi:hypothetical protein
MLAVHRFWAGPKFEGYDWIEATVRSTLGADVITTLDVLAHGTIDYEQVRAEDIVRHDSNIFRLMTLYRFGGLWLDCDVVPLSKTLMVGGPYTAALDDGRREGAVMWFPEPEHPWLDAAIDGIMAQPQSDTARSVDVSGAHYLDSLPDLGVARRHNVFSHDSAGRPLTTMPEAVHLWHTSSKRHEP